MTEVFFYEQIENFDIKKRYTIIRSNVFHIVSAGLIITFVFILIFHVIQQYRIYNNQPEYEKRMYVLIDKLDSLLEESTDSYSIDSIAAYYDETGDTYYYIFNITGVKVLSTGIIDRKSQWGLYVSEGMLSDADGELYFSHQLSEDENPELNEVVKELENSNPIDFYYGFE